MSSCRKLLPRKSQLLSLQNRTCLDHRVKCWLEYPTPTKLVLFLSSNRSNIVRWNWTLGFSRNTLSLYKVPQVQDVGGSWFHGRFSHCQLSLQFKCFCWGGRLFRQHGKLSLGFVKGTLQALCWPIHHKVLENHLDLPTGQSQYQPLYPILILRLL